VNPELGLLTNPACKSGGLLHGFIKGHVVTLLPHKPPYKHYQRIESFARTLNVFLPGCDPPIGNSISWRRRHIMVTRPRKPSSPDLSGTVAA
jgi:hypothetical protein